MFSPVDLGVFPTPITPLPGLARDLGLASLHVKRDDLASPLYGGTKVRALEYLLGAARADAAEGVVTLGASGSHHAVATALFAEKLGLATRVVLFPQPPTPEIARHAAVFGRLGVEVRSVAHVALVPWALWVASRQVLGARRPYRIPAGGSSPLGIVGAVEGALEVAAAVDAGICPRPEVVVVAAGSCGTAAGLKLGFALAGLAVRLVAVRVVPGIVANAWRIRRLAAGGLALLNEAGGCGTKAQVRLVVVGREAGRGYARPTRASSAAVRVAAAAGLRLDTTYTGKAFAHLAAGPLRGRSVLFWNTLSAVDAQLPEASASPGA